MPSFLSPHDQVNMSGQTPQLQRRHSRGSSNQSTGRSARVEKPRSHHNSPRTMERRKTTNEAKLYATLDDHFKMMFGMAPDEVPEERPQPTRPLSWHPSSTQIQSSRASNYFEPMPSQDWSRQYSASPQNSNRGSDFYSLSTRNSMHASTYPNPHANGHHRGSAEESEQNWQGVSNQTPGYVHSALNTPTTEPLPWYLQQWAQKNRTQLFPDFQNASTDFLPIQHPTEQDDEMDEDSGEKLVALGLYDTPEPSSWTGFAEATGKGLKLEETWQPPDEDDDEDDDDEEDLDDASSEASVEEPSPPLPQQAQHLQMPVQGKPHTPGNLEGQSFFFDEDEAASKEWWFHQLKQASVPVRDTGLGYDWE